jgi:hypothetical protein
MARRFPKAAYPPGGLIVLFACAGFWADGPWFALFLAIPVVFGLAAWMLVRRRGQREALTAGLWTAAATLAGSAARQIGFWATATLVLAAFSLHRQLSREG